MNTKTTFTKSNRNFFNNKKKTNNFDALDIALCAMPVALAISMTAEAIINAVKRAKIEIEESKQYDQLMIKKLDAMAVKKSTEEV